MLTTDLETPLDIVKEIENSNSIPDRLVNNILEQGLIDYFTDKPARVRRLKRKHSTRSVSVPTKKPKVESKSKPSVYGGLCNLVTVINSKKGGNVVNSSTSTLYDSKGFEWRRKDLPTYLNLNTTKYIDSKKGFRQRKKDVDTFLMEPKQKTVVKYKKPSIIDAVDVKFEEKGTQKTSELESKSSEESTVSESTKSDEDHPKEESTSNLGKENIVKKEVVEPKRKETNKVVNKTTKREDDELTLASLKKIQRKFAFIYLIYL